MSGILTGFPEAGTADEQVRWLKARLVALHDDTRARMAELEQRQTEVERRMGVYEERLAEQELRIAEIEERLETAAHADYHTDFADLDISPTRH